MCTGLVTIDIVYIYIYMTCHVYMFSYHMYSIYIYVHVYIFSYHRYSIYIYIYIYDMCTCLVTIDIVYIYI